MAGWFEAFSDFARGAAPALDRYAQLRELRDDKRLAAEQRARDEQYRQQQFQLQQQQFGLQQSADRRASEQAAIQANILREALKSSRQANWTKYRGMGDVLTPDVAAEGREIGLGDRMFDAPQELRPTPFSLPGKAYTLDPKYDPTVSDNEPLGDQGVWTRPDAPSPWSQGFQLPEHAPGTALYKGTPEQEQAAYNQAVQRALMRGLDPVNAARVFMDEAPTHPPNRPNSTPYMDAKELWYARNPGRTPTSADVQEWARLDDAAKNAGVQRESPYPSLVKDTLGKYGPPGQDLWLPQSLINQHPGAFGRADTAAQTNQAMATDRILPMLNRARDLALAIHNRYKDDNAFVSGRMDWLKSKMNMDPEITEYLDLIEGPLLTVAAKSIGMESGNLAEGDQQRALRTFYLPWQPPEMAPRKFKNLEDFVLGFSATPGAVRSFPVKDDNGVVHRFDTAVEAETFKRMMAEARKSRGTATGKP